MRTAPRVILGAASLAAIGLGAGTAGTRAAGPSLPYSYPSGIPDANNNLDCNGWSQAYRPVKVSMKALCTDPVQVNPSTGARTKFYDNYHYVGHDEPSVKFISTATNSGNTFTFFQQLSRDPSGTPTTDPNASPTRSDYAELSVAPWFGLPICDPNSYPGGVNGTTVQPAPCTPDSDTNDPNSAGSAFMELQFYPPRYGPFIDSTSCDQTRWCVALTIDSLEAICNPPGFTGCEGNPNCTEPVNFAYLTLDGIPGGPPNPQNTNLETLTPNNDALYMNDGDTLKVEVFEVPDPPGTQGTTADTGGLETRVSDLTTGQTGFTIASASHGFMNTDPSTCNGSPFSFHAEYNTAKQSNQVPWAALEGGVLMQDEIGHGEVCAALMNQDPVIQNYANGDTFVDQTASDNCNDGVSDPNQDPPTNGECAVGTSLSCQPETFEDAPGDNTFGGQTGVGTGLLEVSDGYCLPQGARTVVVNGSNQTWNDPVAFCDQARDQNGDLDYDGTPYWKDWPDGGATHPQTFRYIGPFDTGGNPYPTVQLETDAAGSEGDCNTTTGSGCTVPPYGAIFYPFWSVANRSLDGVSVTGQSNYCVWNFGDDGNLGELDNLGGDFPNPTSGASPFGQYGAPNTARYGGTLITTTLTNPQPNGRNSSQIGTTTGGAYSCPSFTLSQVTNLNANVPEAPWIPALPLAAVGAALVARREIARRTRRPR